MLVSILLKGRRGFIHYILNFSIIIANMSKKAQGYEEYQAVHFAAAYDATKALQMLIELGANPDERDGWQQTPIFLAAKYGEHFFFLQNSDNWL